MKNASLYSLLVLLLSFGGASVVLAEETQEDMEKLCRSYAQEDKVAADELDAYINDCIENLKADKAETAKGQE